MRAIEWSLSAVLGALGLFCMAANYRLLWQEIRAKPGGKTPSLIPIVGGLLGYFALWLCPSVGWSRWAWLPPVLDPGCYLLYFLIMPVVWKLRGYAR